MAHPYDVGTKAWQPDPTEGWVASEVISKTANGDKVKLVFELANGEVCPQQSQELSVLQMPDPSKLTFNLATEKNGRDYTGSFNGGQ